VVASIAIEIRDRIGSGKMQGWPVHDQPEALQE
jgi:hypothetical protein